MGKNKPRHNPDKPQNKYGDFCQRYEEYSYGGCYCVQGDSNDAKVCGGNLHNCIKTKFKRAASRSDAQIKNGDFSRK